MVFKTPLVLLFIPLVCLGVIFWRRRQKFSTFRFSSKEIVSSPGSSWKIRWLKLPFLMRMMTLVLFMVALAGPRSVLEQTTRNVEGIDIVLAIDSSGSMLGEDFTIEGRRVNRLEVVKNVVKEFIDRRATDRIGLVAFAGLAYTVCPLTTDHSWLQENLARVEIGLIKDGTAVGSAIATSLNRLKISEAKSKVVVLLTDGMNNAGSVDPLAAAKAAKALGIKIYTIGAGTKGAVPFPAQDFFGRKVYQNVLIDIDDKMLQAIADETNAKYFRAMDTQSLRNVYEEIDRLEKVKIEEHGYKGYKELFSYFLAAAVMMLIIEIILSNTVLLRLP
jgi:Ca-activated chloride channel family protein